MSGSWGDATEYTAHINNVWKPTIGYAYEFTADSSDGSVPDKTTAPMAGALAAVAIVFDGTTAPNSVTLTVADALGATIVTDTVTATGYLDLDKPMVFLPGALTISVSGNTTSSAKAKISLVFI